MSLSREQFAKWKPGPHHRDPVQETLPFTGAHQWATFKEHPMEEHETVPFMDPSDEKHAEFMPRTPTGRTRPIEHVYRGMSHEEWSQAQKQGHIKSDRRGTIVPEWEGTNAALNQESAEYYRDTTGDGKGVLAKIQVHPDDKWFLSDVDSYARTRRSVPLSRVQILGK